MSFDSVPQQPTSSLTADTNRVQQRQSDDRAARTRPSRSLGPSTRESFHRLTAQVRTALRAHRSSG